LLARAKSAESSQGRTTRTFTSWPRTRRSGSSATFHAFTSVMAFCGKQPSEEGQRTRDWGVGPSGMQQVTAADAALQVARSNTHHTGSRG
jgi:hypothetical protein